jgi:hypothetical protein
MPMSTTEVSNDTIIEDDKELNSEELLSLINYLINNGFSHELQKCIQDNKDNKDKNFVKACYKWEFLNEEQYEESHEEKHDEEKQQKRNITVKSKYSNTVKINDNVESPFTRVVLKNQNKKNCVITDGIIYNQTHKMYEIEIPGDYIIHNSKDLVSFCTDIAKKLGIWRVIINNPQLEHTNIKIFHDNDDTRLAKAGDHLINNDFQFFKEFWNNYNWSSWAA